MNTFTQINKLAVQCQDIVTEYNKDAVKYGFDKAEVKSTEYYELVMTAMLSAGATITDIKVNHVQIALDKFPKEEDKAKTKPTNKKAKIMTTTNTTPKLIDGRKEFQYYTNNLDVKIALRKDHNYYTVFINGVTVRCELTKYQAHELLTHLGAEKK